VVEPAVMMLPASPSAPGPAILLPSPPSPAPLPRPATAPVAPAGLRIGTLTVEVVSAAPVPATRAPRTRVIVQRQGGGPSLGGAISFGLGQS